jgi:hypothetical protein
MDDLERQEIIDAGRGHLVGAGGDPRCAADDARKAAKENAPDLPLADADRLADHHAENAPEGCTCFWGADGEPAPDEANPCPVHRDENAPPDDYAGNADHEPPPGFYDRAPTRVTVERLPDGTYVRSTWIAGGEDPWLVEEIELDEARVGWGYDLFHSLADGGVWGVPRSGLVFQRRGEALALTERMPYLPEIAEAAAEGRDVPASAAELREYQDHDFAVIRDYFAAAGIEVTS